MGVMPCYRKDCDAILCDRYSTEFGYICNECFEELVNCDLDAETFMNTSKGSSIESIDNRRKKLEEVFYDHRNSNWWKGDSASA